jgi:adenylosuccinate synthase
VVHKIAAMMRAHTVIKVGGAQGSHGVRTSSGESFAFSQWGCGTFEGIKTFLSRRMVVSPEALLNEADLLINEWRIRNAFDLLTVDQGAICATPFHGIASRLKELARGNNPRGTIGTGVGEAYRYSQRLPDLAIMAGDISRPDLKDLLIAVREQIRADLEPIIQQNNFLLQDRDAADFEIDRLNDDGFLDYVVERFHKAGMLVNIVCPDYLQREILNKDGVVVVESSHGALTDRYHGFHPHTSAIRTLPCFTHKMLLEAGYDGMIVNIGVHRAYAVRHGAGPMPTTDPGMTESLLPGSHKDENRWQGKIRVGPLDLNLLRYAIDVCGGPKAFDGLAITWFDQIMNNGEWRICKRYIGTDNRTYFEPSGKIIVRRGMDDEQLKHQENLGKQLFDCKPEITTLKIPSVANKDELYQFCAKVFKEELGVPVRMISFGPTERDKMCE